MYTYMGKRTTIYLTDDDLAAVEELGRSPVQLLRDGIASHRSATEMRAEMSVAERAFRPYPKAEQARGQRDR
jgi:hypothetical protein